ncbi:MAG: hypothetical protein KJO07_07425 [Deltaproteobacteria bacterium]|nr:hypothetical protein [Deltaproteobacteria bacterium]
MPFRLIAVLVCALVALTAGPQASADKRQDQLLASADRVAKKVAKLRGLRIKRKIQRGVMTKPQLKKRLLKRVRQEYSPTELAAEELLLKRFGLLDPKQDYLALVIDLLTDQIAGFYDPWDKQLYIASFMAADGGALMAHEIDHALQDQHFGLRKFMGKSKNDSDKLSARQALVEGDGMALMIEFMLDSMGKSAQWGNDQMVKAISSQLGSATGLGSMDKAPLFLREGLVFPYLAGLKFVAHFRKKHPWKRVDRIYSKPPLSTEHILHPASYESYERPDQIKARTLTALPGLAIVHHDVSGELGTRIWLMTHGVPRGRAELAAAGWGGDRMAVLASSGKGQVRGSVGVSSSVWDGEADAIEYFEAATDALSQAVGKPSPVAGKSAFTFAGKAEHAAIERRGDRVVAVIGAGDAAAAIAQVDEVFKTWTLKRR